jgi:hypothetical protein
MSRSSQDQENFGAGAHPGPHKIRNGYRTAGRDMPTEYPAKPQIHSRSRLNRLDAAPQE